MLLKDCNFNIYWTIKIGILLCGLVAQQAHGTIIVNPTDTIVLEGNTTVLNCQVKVDDPANPPQCSWTKGDMVVQLDKSAGKYSFNGDTTQGDCGLEINDAAVDKDDDIWKCTLPVTVNSSGETSSPAKLSVYVMPTNPVIYDEGVPTKPGGNITINENATETITCVSHYGNPMPNIMWTLNGKSMQATTDVVESEDLKKKTYRRTITYEKEFNKYDSGQLLSCLLTHVTITNSPITVDTTINVLYSTTTVELLIPEYVIVDYGMSFKFSCKADGSPTPTYEWIFNSPSVKTQIVSNSPDYVLDAAKDENAGTYTCLAGNDGTLRPTPEVTFEMRNNGVSTAGVIGICVGVIFIVAIAVLVFLVIHLRKRLKNKDHLKSMPNINALDHTPQLRHPNTYHSRGTYMVPLPTEMAPLRPDSDESFDRKDGSHVYMEPHIYDNQQPSRPPPRAEPPPIPKTPPPPRIQHLPSYLELTSDSFA